MLDEQPKKDAEWMNDHYKINREDFKRGMYIHYKYHRFFNDKGEYIGYEKDGVFVPDTNEYSNTPIEDKQEDLSEFLFEVKNVRNDFVRKANDDWWLKIGVERVVFEDILIMYDQMYERLKEIAYEIKAALQKQPNVSSEPIKTITIDGITYELKFLRNAYDIIDESEPK